MIVSDHILMGVAIGLSSNSDDPFIMTAAVCGSVFPDLDLVHGRPGTINYLAKHRTYTHSLFFTPFYSFIIALILSIFSFDHNYLSLWPWVFVGVIGHLAVDILNSFGTTIFYPINKKRIALDIIFEFDIIFSLIFIIGIILFLLRSTIKINPINIIFLILILFIAYLFYSIIRRNVFSKATIPFIQDIKDKIISISIVPATFGKWKAIFETNDKFYIIRKIKKKFTVEKRIKMTIPENIDDTNLNIYKNYARHLDVNIDGSKIVLLNLVYSSSTYRFEGNITDSKIKNINISVPKISEQHY